MSSTNQLKILKITMKDEDEVYKLLNRSFFTDEPLNYNHYVPSTKEQVFALKCIPQGYSIKMVDNDGNIAAICLNLDFSKISKKDTKPTTNRIHKIYDLMNFVDSQIEKIPNLLDLYIVTVEPVWRNQGLAGKLCEETERIAMENGFNGVSITCSNYYSAKMAENKGYKCIYSLDYANYCDEQNMPIFTLEEPHKNISVHVKLFK